MDAKEIARDRPQRPRSAGQTGEADKTRVQIDLAPGAMEALSLLKEDAEAASYTEVIRQSLKEVIGLARLLSEQDGSRLQVRRPDGAIIELRLSFVSEVADGMRRRCAELEREGPSHAPR